MAYTLLTHTVMSAIDRRTLTWVPELKDLHMPTVRLDR
jgi:hypothetical protein